MRILAANFFPAFHPPRSGGEQRYYYLYRYLSRYYDVTLLSPTYSHHAFEVVTFSSSFRELRVPKQILCDRLHWQLDASGIGPECSAYIVALASAWDTEYSSRFASAAIEADIIIHESPFTLPYDKSFGIDGKPRIYNAYNVEHRLADQVLRGESGRKAIEFIRFLEHSLSRHANLIFTTSEEDRQLLSQDFAIEAERIALAPNGFEPAEDAPRTEANAHGHDESYVVFMGSAHPPNVEAGSFVVEQLAPALPEVEFRIMGAVCDKMKSKVPRNVKLLGFVEESEKRLQIERCTAAINPLFSGSGTNLKMLDYLSAGAPVVTTRVGARGLSLADGITALVVDIEGFIDRLKHVLADAPLRARLAEAGKRKAFAEFTWRHIADRVHESIGKVIPAKSTNAAAGVARATLLVVNDFPVEQCSSGGEVRIRELLTELGQEFEVTLLCLTQDAHASARILGRHVREIRIPKTSEHRDAEIRAGRGERVSVNDLLAAEYCVSNRSFVAAFRQIASTASAVIFEHPYLAPLLEYLQPHVPVIYSALNVERTFKAELLRARRDVIHRVAQVGELEQRILERADLVVCVSKEDRGEFLKRFEGKRYVVIENGVRASNRPANRVHSRDQDDGGALAVFVGSAHPPNIEAVRFLIEVLAPAIPSLTVVIVGSVCSGVGLLPMPPNMHLLGVLGDAEKNELLARASLALNPLFQGGGSSLKVSDFFASGLPMVSTETGVRGYDVRDGEHYLRASRDDFVEKTFHLVGNRELRAQLGSKARRYAETVLDWGIIGLRYRRAMKELVGGKRVPRVLVVTYRFADPPPGGAEAYMVNVLRELAQRGNVHVEVATCDVGIIANKWHFSASYSKPAHGAGTPPYVDAVYRFPVDAPHPDDFGRCARLFAVWMAEMREQALTLDVRVGSGTLLGGWNFPERHGDGISRWTSRESQLHVDPLTKAMRIRGRAPRPMRIEVRRGVEALASRVLDGQFEWALDLRADDTDSIVTLWTERPYQADDDPRELGFIVREIALHDGTRWHSIDLSEDFDSISMRSDARRWVSSLIEITRQRNRADDNLFFAVRGPHSAELNRWLDAELPNYDVVVAQGIPFSIPVTVTETALRHGVPVVLLPHFHMEDRYYHWRRYYDSFRDARCVIAAPESVKSMFFDGIGASSVLVSGGGVDLDEFEPVNLVRGEHAFEALHIAAKPFVLVLGRKTGAKNYRMAINAVSELNAAEHRLDLVLIGPDEDGIEIHDPHVYCYGAQSRDVVVGALGRALCLVNMSESESFGIVLLESWLAGRPVIAQRNCIAFSDLVVSGRNGFLVESPSELAATIETYRVDEGTATRHAVEGRALAERHAWSRIAEQIEGILMDATRTTAPAKMELSDV